MSAIGSKLFRLFFPDNPSSERREHRDKGITDLALSCLGFAAGAPCIDPRAAAAGIAIGAAFINRCCVPRTPNASINQSGFYETPFSIDDARIPPFSEGHLDRTLYIEGDVTEPVKADCIALCQWYQEAYPENQQGYDNLRAIIDKAYHDDDRDLTHRRLMHIVRHFNHMESASMAFRQRACFLAARQRSSFLGAIASATDYPTACRMIKEKYDEVICVDPEKRILQLLLLMKERIIVDYCQNKRGRPDLIPFFKSRLSEKLGLDVGAAKLEGVNINPEFLNEAVQYFLGTYTESFVVNELTRIINEEIQTNEGLCRAIDSYLSDNFKEHRYNNYPGRWLTENEYGTFHTVEEISRNPGYLQQNEQHLRDSGYENVVPSGAWVRSEVLRLQTIGPKTTILYLQNLGILQAGQIQTE